MDNTAPAQLRSLHEELAALRQALWDCYVLAGGEPQSKLPADLDSTELVPMVLDCVHDLRAHYEAARFDR